MKTAGIIDFGLTVRHFRSHDGSWFALEDLLQIFPMRQSAFPFFWECLDERSEYFSIIDGYPVKLINKRGLKIFAIYMFAQRPDIFKIIKSVIAAVGEKY